MKPKLPRSPLDGLKLTPLELIFLRWHCTLGVSFADCARPYDMHRANAARTIRRAQAKVEKFRQTMAKLGRAEQGERIIQELYRIPGELSPDE